MTKRGKRLTLIGGVLSVTVVAAALVLTALSSTVAYFYTPSDLAAATPKGVIRLGGLVVDGSVKFAHGDETAVTFTIRDEVAETPVTYKGVLPDLFREGQGVIVQGKLSPDGRVVVSEVLAKHDEKYMPKEVADALKKQGRWKEGEAP